ncbi:MAG TPA: hypothetical protein DF712_03340 [Balneola sp.]|jgi:hypothetical protein|nr:hypothetical protein [Balneola sp.]MBF63837.1 hypothetical protein [Balneola sp.]HAH50620.1 hypothetical protein [Balneola sp.]HAW78284.1 hypothetical protein [Balneola sp.]HBZ37909.1 hypothetical protein [Balneola sp.]|tara:strand:+ start:3534 stop:4034 length:501 start_codon:yes stop_codon:yes gene_type:complete
MKIRSSFLFLLIVFISSSLFAQNEVETERHSLIGIKKFGISVEIEKPIGLKEATLNPAQIQKEINESFETLPVTLLNFNELKESFYNPFFYVHVNIMQAEDGIYPFSIEMRFYQPIKLSLKNDLESMASTWHSGYVGMVSFDRVNEIAGVVVEATKEFKEEFERLN